MLQPTDNITPAIDDDNPGDNLLINPEDVTFEDLVLDPVDAPEPKADAEEKKEEEEKVEIKKEKEEKEEEEVEKKDSKKKEEEEEEEEESEKKDEEEATEEEVEEESAPLIPDIADYLGINLPEDHDYDESIEGIGNLVADIITAGLNQKVTKFFEQNEETARYHQFLQQGGDPRKYFDERFSGVDFSRYEVKEGDVATQKLLVRNFYKAQGIEDEQIQATIDVHEAGGTLEHTAKLAKTALVNAQEKQEVEFKKKQDLAVEEEKNKADTLFNTVSETISKQTEFAGVVIPKRDLDDLPEYMLTKVQGGKTQRDLDVTQFTLDQQILLSWVIKNGFKLDAVVSALANRKSAKSLRTRLKVEAEKSKTGSDRTSENRDDTTKEGSKIKVQDLELDLTNLV